VKGRFSVRDFLERARHSNFTVITTQGTRTVERSGRRAAGAEDNRRMAEAEGMSLLFLCHLPFCFAFQGLLSLSSKACSV
jgi:hypothetical protein